MGDPDSNKPGCNSALSENSHPASAFEVSIPDQAVPVGVFCRGSHTLVFTGESRLTLILNRAPRLMKQGRFLGYVISIDNSKHASRNLFGAISEF